MRILGIEFTSSSLTPSVNTRSDAGFSDEYYTSMANWGGRGVNPTTAMQSSAVYSCVRLISEIIGSLPLITYRRLKSGGRERATDHPLYQTLQISPNVRNTRMEFIETMCWNLLLRGNFYARIKYSGGKVQLEQLNPDKMTIEISARGLLSYVYQEGGVKIRYNRYDILHVRGHSEDGIIGKSPIDVARETIYRAMMMEKYHTKTYEQGTKLAGILEAKEPLTDEVAERISKSFREAYSGPSNVGKVALLEDEVTFKPISMSLEQAEFIAGRELTRSEIAGLFGCPPHMIGDLSNATFSNIEEQGINFLTYTIRTWLVRIEQALMRDLFIDDQEKSEYYIEFLPDALLRGNTLNRMTAYKMGLESGVLKFNEAREMDNRNPLEWGDATMIPLNFKPVASVEDFHREPATSGSNGVNNDKGGAQNDPTN